MPNSFKYFSRSKQQGPPNPPSNPYPNQPANPQHLSLFFHLPYELRLQIYKLILPTTGCSAIHILTTAQIATVPAIPWDDDSTPNDDPSLNPHRLNFAPCVAHLGDPFLVTGTHYGYWPKGHLACFQRHCVKSTVIEEGRLGMNFLLSCQRIYDETTSLIYPTLRIEFLGLLGAFRFLTQLTPSSLSKIRTLHLSFQTATFIPTAKHPNPAELPRWIFGPGRPRDVQEETRMELWHSICSFLPHLTSLDSLRISIFDDAWPSTSEVELVKPLVGLFRPHHPLPPLGSNSSGRSPESSPSYRQRGKYILELASIEPTSPGTPSSSSSSIPPLDEETLAPFVLERRARSQIEWDEVQIERAIRLGNRPGPVVQVVLVLCLPVFGAYYVVDRVWRGSKRGWKHLGVKVRARYDV